MQSCCITVIGLIPHLFEFPQFCRTWNALMDCAQTMEQLCKNSPKTANKYEIRKSSLSLKEHVNIIKTLSLIK